MKTFYRVTISFPCGMFVKDYLLAANEQDAILQVKNKLSNLAFRGMGNVMCAASVLNEEPRKTG